MRLEGALKHRKTMVGLPMTDALSAGSDEMRYTHRRCTYHAPEPRAIAYDYISHHGMVDEERKQRRASLSFASLPHIMHAQVVMHSSGHHCMDLRVIISPTKGNASGM
jgi:hypothetical protein